MFDEGILQFKGGICRKYSRHHKKECDTAEEEPAPPVASVMGLNARPEGAPAHD
jgi:hypothetical protein